MKKNESALTLNLLTSIPVWLKYTLYIFFIFHFSLLTFNSFSQGIAINVTGDSAANSAILDLSSTTKGLLLTRMTTAQRDAINLPAEGLIIYNLECHNLNYFTGSAWMPLNSLGGLVPATPGSITGSTNVCSGQLGVNYTVSAVSGATSYTWIVPEGSSVSSGQGSSGIAVTFGTNSGNLCVSASNSCGSSSSSCLSVTNNLTPGAAGIITGTNTVCQGQNNVAYSVTAISNATGYTWTLPTGASIASGSNTNSINVNFSASASSGNITVYGTNSICNGTASSAFSITVNPLPAAAGTITGTNTVNTGQNNVSYSIPAITNATSYTWAYSGAGVTISGTTNAITINFSVTATSGDLTVTGTNACGNGVVSADYPITVNQPIALDATSSAVAGPESSKTWSHTCTGSNLILIVGTEVRGNGTAVTSLTYNGVAMTQIGSPLVGSTLYYDKIQLFYLIAPATGTHDIVLTHNGSYVGATAVSYTGVKQSGQPDASTEQGPSSNGTYTTTLTTIANNCWTILLCHYANSGGTGGTGTTYLNLESMNIRMFHSNGAITPAGSTSLQTIGTPNDYVCHKMISIAPANP
ncbi:MAG: hypothetical protein HGB12_00430 [Bacteroidetes bacterium]|nr:hypothetical protein [Bacteroidota bacterium]